MPWDTATDARTCRDDEADAVPRVEGLAAGPLSDETLQEGDEVS